MSHRSPVFPQQPPTHPHPPQTRSPSFLHQAEQGRAEWLQNSDKNLCQENSYWRLWEL